MYVGKSAMLSAIANLSTLVLVEKGTADFIQVRVMPQRKKPFYLGESDSVDGGVSRLWTRPVNREDLSPDLGAVPTSGQVGSFKPGLYSQP